MNTNGMMLSEGEVVLTRSGRPTTPFPKIDCPTNKKSINTLKRVDKWLWENAIKEAESRDDRYNLLQFRLENPLKLPQATKDGMELYLFGDH